MSTQNPTNGTGSTFRREFIREPLLRQARRYADAELLNRADEAQIRWLYEHPVWWLRALIQIEFDVNNHIEKNRRTLSTLPRTTAGEQAAYLRAKAETDEKLIRKVHFKRVAERRKEEIRSIFGGALNVPQTGDLVTHLLMIAQLIDEDEVADARDLALRWAEKLGGA